MISFSQLLNESRAAPLYHSTLPYTAAQILQSNKIKATEPANSYTKSISLTRSLPFALAWRDANTWGEGVSFSVVFELDQSLLTQRHRIAPYNDFPGEGARSQKDAVRSMGKIKGFPHGFVNQFEELVFSDIAGINRYIRRLIVSDVRRFDNLATKSEAKLIADHLINHPKLFDLRTNSFVNA